MTILLFLAAQEVEIRRLPLDSIVDKAAAQIDGDAIKAQTETGATVRLFEVADPGIDNMTLVYEALVRTEMSGRAYLQMWCRFPAKGEFFSLGLDTEAQGTRGWTLMRTSFFLKKGEKPDLIRLNLVLEGKGSAWIKDIRLLRGTSPWFDIGWASYSGAIAGCVLGLWGALVGTLGARGKARRFVIGSTWTIVVACSIVLAAGAAALIARQPYEIWFPLALIGALGTTIPAAHLMQMSRAYREAERRRMSAQDL